VNYYKITNEFENHHGMQYKDGLNTDILPFNPHGTCTDGGIYFSREDILAFLDYGPWIRRVTLPQGEPVYKDPGPIQKWKAHRVILGEREEITLDVIKRLIQEGADVTADNCVIIVIAAETKNYELMEFILTQMPKEIGLNLKYAMHTSARHDDVKMIDLLLPLGKHLQSTFETAATYGGINVIKRLLPLVDPKENESAALRLAVNDGRDLNIVKLLLPVSDPKAKDSEALRTAAATGNMEMLELLLPVSDRPNTAFVLAAMHGRLEIVKKLMPFYGKKVYTEALFDAIRSNQVNVVRFLLPVADTHQVLSTAAQYGNAAMIRLLMPEFKDQAEEAIRMAMSWNRMDNADLIKKLFC
jgi:ankyrin repeat protein